MTRCACWPEAGRSPVTRTATWSVAATQLPREHSSSRRWLTGPSGARSRRSRPVTPENDGHGGPPPAPSYAAAMTELDAILRALEDDELDVDALASRVARAAELLRWCRARI